KPWSAVLTTAERICAADQSGCCCRTTAAEPARCGVAIDVPWKNAKQGLPPQKDTGIELSTLTPGAMTSGLIRKSTSVGPWLLTTANSPLAAPKVLADTETGAPTKWGTVVAPAVNARAADPGDSTVKWPGPELPAATATTILAWSRLSTAIVSRSEERRVGKA